jgi:DNA-binding response OmpR family regulator
MVPLVVVIDSSARRGGLLRNILEHAGYRVEVLTTPTATSVQPDEPSLIMLAVDLLEGGQHPRAHIFCQLLPATVPILLLGDGRSENEASRRYRCEGFLGARFTVEQVIAVVETALRSNILRAVGGFPSSSEIAIQPSAMRIFVQGKEIPTTTLEFRLLNYMAQHQGKVFTRDSLLQAVWGDLHSVTPRTVDACIRRLRRKIEPQFSSPRFLRTIRGIGYKLDARPTWQAN